MARDFHNNLEQTTLLANSTISTDTNTDSAILDTVNYSGTEFILTGNAITDGNYAIQIREGEAVDDPANPTTITNASTVEADDILATPANLALTSTDTGKSVRFGYIGNYRYLQVRIVSTNTTSGGTFNVIAVQGRPKKAATPDLKA